jgi:hypothetical protein
MISKAILATFYLVVTVLLRFVTIFLPDTPNDTFLALAEEPSHLEPQPQDPGGNHLTEVPQIVITGM